MYSRNQPDRNFEHSFENVSTVQFTHSLAKIPVVQVLDEIGNSIECNIIPSRNDVQINFISGGVAINQSGKVILN